MVFRSLRFILAKIDFMGVDKVPNVTNLAMHLGIWPPHSSICRVTTAIGVDFVP